VGANEIEKIARHVGVNHQSVSNRTRAHAQKLPESPTPEKVENAEMDEWFTFVGRKKNKIYIITLVDRATRCILGWALVWERTKEVIPLVLMVRRKQS